MIAHTRLIVPLLLAVLLAAVLAACAPDVEDPGPDAREQYPADCPPQVGAEVAEVIADQLDAFAADDYAGALALASRSFQAGTDLAAFRQLIEASFPQVADSREHRVLGCLLVAPRTTHSLVSVTGRDGSREELVYILVEEDDGSSLRWAVSAAALHERGDTLTA